MPFAFDSAGSQIIFYDPGVDYREAEMARAGHAPVCRRELAAAV